MIPSVSDHIVVVDNENVLADLIAEWLRIAGFENITVFTDPREALKAIQGNARPAIVITDFIMQGLAGVELLNEIERHHPGIDGVVVTSNTSAATETPHRYPVLNKSTNNFRQDLIAHTLGIIQRNRSNNNRSPQV